MNRGLTLRTGQCHVQRYMKPLLGHIEAGRLDPTRIVTHTMPLTQSHGPATPPVTGPPLTARPGRARGQFPVPLATLASALSRLLLGANQPPKGRTAPAKPSPPALTHAL